MRILSVKSKPISETTRRKFVGVFLSQQINSFLSLFALSKQTTKSMIIRDQMEEWHQSKRGMDATRELIKEITDRLELPDAPSAQMTYKRKLKMELKRKGINQDDLTAILTVLERK